MRRRPMVDLLAELPDEHIDGTVAVRGAPAPDTLEQLVAREDTAQIEGERVEQPELGGRQVGALAVDVRLHVLRVQAKLLDHDLVATTGILRARATPGGCADPCRQLLHRERFHEVVVGANFEGVHPVVLGAAG